MRGECTPPECNPMSVIPVFISEKVSDPRAQVARPAGAGRVTRGRRSRDPRARVADFLGDRNGNLPILSDQRPTQPQFFRYASGITLTPSGRV